MSTQAASLIPLEATSLQPLYTPKLSARRKVDQVVNPPLVHWCGRCITRSVQAAAAGAYCVFNCVVNSVAAAVDETDMLHSIFRKLDRHILVMIEQLKQTPPDYFKRFSPAIRTSTCALDFISIIVDIGYYVSKSYKQDTSIEVYGKMWLTASDIGYGFLWLQELGITKLSNVFAGMRNYRVFNFAPAVVENIPVLCSMPRVQQAAASIGNLRIFSFTTRITLKSFAQGTFSLAYLFFITQSFQNFIYAVKAGEANRMMDATLRGLCFASEFALESLLFFGYTSVTGLGVLAIASIAFSVAKLSHAIFMEEQNKARSKGKSLV